MLRNVFAYLLGLLHVSMQARPYHDPFLGPIRFHSLECTPSSGMVVEAIYTDVSSFDELFQLHKLQKDYVV